VPEIIKVYVTAAEKHIFEEYAAADGRSLSNLMKQSAKQIIRRNRKKRLDGEIILTPEESAE
jgi:hypothetical protein